MPGFRHRNSSKSFLDRLDPRHLTLRAQNNLACSFPNQTRRLFLDSTTRDLLDCLHQVFIHYTKSKHRAEWIVKQLIKIGIRILVIESNGALQQEQKDTLCKCRELLRQAGDCIIRQIQAAPIYSSSKSQDIAQIQAAVRTVVTCSRVIFSGLASEKSVRKMCEVVLLFSDEAFLCALISNEPPYAELVLKIAQGIQESIDRGLG